MTEAERNLLVWCALMLASTRAFATKAEAEVIARLIAEVRGPMPMPRWDAVRETWVVDQEGGPS